MALNKDIIEEAEFAKNHLMQSDLDDKCKKSLLRLLNISTMATNGISTEEKVQKITEIIQGLVISQITFLDSIDKRIEIASKEHCKTCKAMKHAIDVEEEEKAEKIIAAWKAANANQIVVIPDGTDGTIDDGNKTNGSENSQKDDITKMSIIDIIKLGFVKPYGWILCAIAVFSPHCVDILQMIMNFFK